MNTSRTHEPADPSVDQVHERLSPPRTDAVSLNDTDTDDASSIHTVRAANVPDSFARVAADAELFSLDGTATSASSTVYGLGSTAGHGLMVMGEWILRRADSVTAIARARSAVSFLRANREKPSQYKLIHAQTLLEYQRIHVYPDRARALAWGGILLMLATGQWRLLIDALVSMSDIEVQFFLRQLALCKLVNWKASIVNGYPSPVETAQEILSGSWRDTLSVGYSNLVTSMIASRWELLLQVLSVSDILSCYTRSHSLLAFENKHKPTVMLLEYQRQGVHPDDVRAAAWHGIIVTLCTEQWELLRDALVFMSDIDVQDFLRQLALCKLVDWGDSIVYDYPSPAETAHEILQESGMDSLSMAYSNLVTSMIASRCKLLRRVLPVIEFLSCYTRSHSVLTFEDKHEPTMMLLDYQRPTGHYDDVRAAAWNGIIVTLCAEQWELLRDALVSMSDINVQDFLRQLTHFKLSGWCDSIVKGYPSPVDIKQEILPRQDTLSVGYSNLVTSLIASRYELLLQVLFVSEILSCYTRNHSVLAYEDKLKPTAMLLEYQRPNVHPDDVRAAAWHGIVVTLYSNQWELLRDALVFMSDIDMQNFLRQLTSCQVANWSISIVNGYPSPVELAHEHPLNISKQSFIDTMSNHAALLASTALLGR